MLQYARYFILGSKIQLVGYLDERLAKQGQNGCYLATRLWSYGYRVAVSRDLSAVSLITIELMWSSIALWLLIVQMS